MVGFGKYQILHHLVRLNIDIPFPKEESQVWCAVPWDMEGAMGNRCTPVSFSAALPGHVQDLLVQGLTTLGSPGAFIHGYKVREPWPTRPQSSQQEGDQAVLGLGLTRSVPCGVNGYFLPLRFSTEQTVTGGSSSSHSFRLCQLLGSQGFPGDFALGGMQSCRQGRVLPFAFLMCQ